MGLGREVHDRLDAVAGERLGDESLVADVPVNEVHPAFSLELGDGAAVPGIGQGVEHDELILRMAPGPVAHEVGTDEARAACDEQFHDRHRLIGLGRHARFASDR